MTCGSPPPNASIAVSFYFNDPFKLDNVIPYISSCHLVFHVAKISYYLFSPITSVHSARYMEINTDLLASLDDGNHHQTGRKSPFVHRRRLRYGSGTAEGGEAVDTVCLADGICTQNQVSA